MRTWERTFQVVGRTCGHTLRWSKLRVLEAHPEANVKEQRREYREMRQRWKEEQIFTVKILVFI